MSAGSAYARGQTDDPQNRHPRDFYPTFPAATEALLRVEKFEGGIWEPAAGMGDMAWVLARRGPVLATDLYDYGASPERHVQPGVDFLQQLPRDGFPNIVTNPPFKLAKKFVTHACGISTGKVAMLMRLAMLEGIKRRRWWGDMPLVRVWVMSRRVPMRRGRLATPKDKHGPLAFAWFVFEPLRLNPRPELCWLDWADSDAAPGEKAAAELAVAA